MPKNVEDLGKLFAAKGLKKSNKSPNLVTELYLLYRMPYLLQAALSILAILYNCNIRLQSHID